MSRKRGPTPGEKLARKLRISHGLEAPPKARQREREEPSIDPMIRKMGSIFDTHPVNKKGKKRPSEFCHRMNDRDSEI